MNREDNLGTKFCLCCWLCFRTVHVFDVCSRLWQKKCMHGFKGYDIEQNIYTCYFNCGLGGVAECMHNYTEQ